MHSVFLTSPKYEESNYISILNTLFKRTSLMFEYIIIVQHIIISVFVELKSD